MLSSALSTFRGCLNECKHFADFNFNSVLLVSLYSSRECISKDVYLLHVHSVETIAIMIMKCLYISIYLVSLKISCGV